jgi:hypothetical protein
MKPAICTPSPDGSRSSKHPWIIAAGMLASLALNTQAATVVSSCD